MLDRLEVWGTSLISLGELVLDRMSDLRLWISPHSNSIHQTMIVVTLLLTWIGFRAALRFRSIRRTRASIPLSIGGWGSRGKSGTERLKVGLFYGLGYQVFSKTTGTLPAFISGLPGLAMAEIPLFRVYDKASIWEQVTVLTQASRMRAQVFLWEAMALNPRYVQILQHDWMRDDIATITNTYPDHEDIQGPAGIDVAETISLFTPKNSEMLTSEQQMLPLLENRSNRFNTSFRAVTPLFSKLLPEDTLERFPYREHPLNVELCVALADRLDISRLHAMDAMVENLIADIGALKIYQGVNVEGREIELTNVCAANERAGFLGSVTSLSYLNLDEVPDFKVRQIAVVNNRADRPARSVVFAKILAEDFPADGVLVIGTSTETFRESASSFYETRIQNLTQPKKGSEPSEWEQWVNRALFPLRIRVAAIEEIAERYTNFLPVEKKKIVDALTTALGGVDSTMTVAQVREGLRSKLESWAKPLLEMGDGENIDRGHREFTMRTLMDDMVNWLVAHCAAEYLSRSSGTSFSQELCEFWRDRFLSRISVETNADAGADTLLMRIAEQGLYGGNIRAVAMQNIKGPGMKIVDRFYNLEPYLKVIVASRSPNPIERESAWVRLKETPIKNASQNTLLEKRIHEAFEEGRDQEHANLAKNLLLHSEKKDNKIEEQALQSTQVNSTKTSKPKNEYLWLNALGDGAFDFLDSIYRRNRADQVMLDLANGIMSHDEAAYTLNKVYKRQKSGVVSYLRTL